MCFYTMYRASGNRYDREYICKYKGVVETEKDSMKEEISSMMKIMMERQNKRDFSGTGSSI